MAVSIPHLLKPSLVALGAAVLLAVASVSVAAAQDEVSPVIGSARITSTTIDMSTRWPTAKVTVTCLKDSDYVRIRLTLEQKGVRRPSFSQETWATTCLAGTTLVVAVVFYPQQGTFRPGHAEIYGFVAANNVGLLDDSVQFPLTDVHLRPT
jgi:hypothetical protein